MDTKILSGQAALVTGGGGGIGGASAKWLARDGAAVMIMGRTESTLADARNKIKNELGPDAIVEYFAGDALDADSVQAALEATAKLAERLAIAVSVVGGGSAMKPLLMWTDSEAMEDLRLNIVSAFLVIKHATPFMVQGGGGSIVCISSDAAKIPWPYLTIYNTAKHGVEGLVKGAAIELGRLNVRVNAVRPGLVDTSKDPTQFSLFHDKAVLKLFVDEKPLGRTGVPDDIGAGVRYLAGPESSWVTGQSIGIEGGNELTKAPDLESIVRMRVGDDAAVDAALAGRIP